MSIESLKKYQARRRHQRFDGLNPLERAVAEAHYQRLCLRWGDDLPQWRRAILVGRAKDLAIRPRDGAWARRLRRHGKRRSSGPAVSMLAPPQPALRAVTVAAQLVPASPVKSASSLPQPSISPTPHAHAIRLDIRGITTSGSDGFDTAQRILRDLENRAFNSPQFTMAVPRTDLPPRWAWRLEVVPVS